MRYRVLAAVLSVGLCVAPVAEAQETVAPRRLFRGTVERETPWLALLREANAEGSQETLVSVITEFLADLSRAVEIAGAGSAACCDQREHVFQVAFLATAAADAPLVRIFVHKHGLTRGALPGIAGREQPLLEVFAAEDLSIELASLYQSTPLEDPLTEQSADFAKLVLGKLALPIGASEIASRVASVMKEATRTPEQLAMRQTRPPLAITLSRVELPDRRAKITVSHKVAVSDPAAHIRAQATWIADTVLRRSLVRAALADTPDGSSSSDYDTGEGQGSGACSTMAGDIAAAAGESLDAAPCAPLPAEPAGCFKAVEAAVSRAYQESAGGSAACPPDRAFPLVRRFLSAIPSRPSDTTGAVVLANVPESHWSFGLGTAFIAAIDADNARPRTRISSGRIVVDPFERVLAMGLVNFIPAGYDPAAVRLTAPQRIRLFGGVAFAPHFGATGGAAWSITRYLAVNAGYALLVYDTPKAGEFIDAAPSPENRAAPFELAGTHALFIGLSYNLK